MKIKHSNAHPDFIVMQPELRFTKDISAHQGIIAQLEVLQLLRTNALSVLGVTSMVSLTIRNVIPVLEGTDVRREQRLPQESLIVL